MSSKTALVIVADGTEEMEAVIVIDCLRRANISVDVAGVDGDKQIVCRSNTKITPDLALSSCSKTLYDVVVLPGGLQGVQNIHDSLIAKDIVIRHIQNGKLISAICAAPTAIHDWNLVDSNKKLTCYPSLGSKITKCKWVDEKLVVDLPFITSQGPGTSFLFALEIIKKVVGESAMHQVKNESLI